MELVAESVPITVEEPWQVLPDIVLGAVDILDDYLHLLRISEAVPIHQSLIFLQKVFDWLLNVAQEVRCKFGSNQGHGGDAEC